MNKCDTCTKEYNEDKWPCTRCIDNPHIKSFYIKKVNPLKNLFKGAPVITDSPAIAESAVRRYYHKDKSCFHGGTTNWSTLDINASKPWASIRLPTIDESPRNVWLAAPSNSKCPEGAELLDIVVWIKGRNAPSHSTSKGDSWDWTHVTKFMIIDKKKFEDET